MNAPLSRRRIGWLASIAACATLVAAFSVNAHAVKSEVLLAERQIIALEREMQMLETEFQARASQRQLADWNALELGYEAARADQYFDDERQLASLAAPEMPGTPSPIRVAVAEASGAGVAARPMASPVTGEPVALAIADKPPSDAGTMFAAAFGDLLIDASPIRAARSGVGLIDTATREAAE